MNINDKINNGIYTHQTKDNNKKVIQDNSDTLEARIKESFDLSILHKNHAESFDAQEAQSVLKNVNYENETSGFSKDNLSGFSQPITHAQANLSVEKVLQLLQ